MSKHCTWVDVGFIHEKLVCKQCDRENMTRNHKLEQLCTAHSWDTELPWKREVDGAIAFERKLFGSFVC